ncbi:MAG: PRC-barrel domain-containing protein [Bacillota bacterium]
MASLRETLGQPVVQQGSGRVLGRVRDLLVDARGRQVVALLLAPGTWFAPPRGLPWTQVRALEPNRVVAEGEPVELAGLGREVLTLDQLAARSPYAAADTASLEDVVFQPASGRVEGYHLSGGILQDILDGRHYVEADRLAAEILPEDPSGLT